MHWSIDECKVVVCSEDESEEAVLVDLRVLWQDENPLQQQSAGSGPLPSSSEGTVEEASMDVDDEEARAGPSETGSHVQNKQGRLCCLYAGAW